MTGHTLALCIDCLLLANATRYSRGAKLLLTDVSAALPRAEAKRLIAKEGAYLQAELT